MALARQEETTRTDTFSTWHTDSAKSSVGLPDATEAVNCQPTCAYSHTEREQRDRLGMILTCLSCHRAEAPRYCQMTRFPTKMTCLIHIGAKIAEEQITHQQWKPA